MRTPNKKRWVAIALLSGILSGSVWIFGSAQATGDPIIVRTPKLQMELEKIDKDPLPLNIQVERR
ncbi:hypothetical protein [Thermoactinomyces mirandus]|uniref:Uncharacterized protein n=1 Tax=Thermoactinomyces mirandus TaxID=2756294 RepID=A0A7W1XU15_9BACL|nr:hypothetical protein [Thermoactinomyces mirandus]MBA4603010.1 hypothetical protein [Thermoactinomyces mirandus]